MTRRCCCGSQGQGGDLVAAAATLSVAIAQGKTAEELELLSAVFDIMADSLGLLALKAPSQEHCSDPAENLSIQSHENC